MSKCKWCGQEILWFRHGDVNRAMEPEPAYVVLGDGREIYFDEAGQEAVGRDAREDEIPEGYEERADMLWYKPHRPNCGKR